MSLITCDRCTRTRRVIVDTDLYGNTIDLTPPCECEGRKVCPCGAVWGRQTPQSRTDKCPECRREYNKRRARERRERLKQDPEWVARERERWLRVERAKRERDPEGYNRKRRERKRRNAERESERNREYRARNAERLRAYERRRHQRDRERRNAYRNEYRRAMRELELRQKGAA